MPNTRIAAGEKTVLTDSDEDCEILHDAREEVAGKVHTQQVPGTQRNRSNGISAVIVSTAEKPGYSREIHSTTPPNNREASEGDLSMEEGEMKTRSSFLARKQGLVQGAVPDNLGK